MITCKNCNATINEKYCPNCGQPATLKRIDGHYIKHEIEHLLHLEKGIFYTIKELLIRPGENVREFISDNRSRLVKPVIFVIITALIYTVLIRFFNIKDKFISIDGTKSTVIIVMDEWLKNHYGYTLIIMGVFIALWLKLFFKKYGYNFFEILILLCFVLGMGMLILSLPLIVLAMSSSIKLRSKPSQCLVATVF